MKNTTIVATVAGASVMWEPTTEPAALDPNHHDAGDVIDGGFLLGDPDLVRRVRETLADADLAVVRVAEPGVDYTFTDTRDTVADVVAAMAHVAAGRGLFNAAGRRVIAEVLMSYPEVIEISPDEVDDFDFDSVPEGTVVSVGPVIY